jgi:hypothetical protein
MSEAVNQTATYRAPIPASEEEFCRIQKISLQTRLKPCLNSEDS